MKRKAMNANCREVQSDMSVPLHAEFVQLRKMESAARINECLEWYDMGTKLGDVVRDEANYGSNAIEQIAEYLGFDPKDGGRLLHERRLFAESFDRDFILSELQLPMADGLSLAVEHFKAIQEINPVELRKQLLDLARQDALSPEALKEVAGRYQGSQGKP